MRRIFAIGEMVFDIIFKNGKPVTSTPGGSMLNMAVSLGRLGMDVRFIGEYGKDKVGTIVDAFLAENGVNTDCVCRYDNYPSSLALAFLNENNNAEYEFYKNYPDNRLDVAFPELTADDIVVFGSFYGMDPDIRFRLTPFLKHAKDRNALIIYDPNFRASRLSDHKVYDPILAENFGFADIVKGSDEDFLHIFGAKSDDEAWQAIRDKCDVLFLTANKDNVRLYMPGIADSYRVPPIVPISTVGAGDTFNAGLVYGLVTRGIDKSNVKSMDEKQRAAIAEDAIKFAGSVCMSYDNYLSRDFADKVIRRHHID